MHIYVFNRIKYTIDAEMVMLNAYSQPAMVELNSF